MHRRQPSLLSYWSGNEETTKRNEVSCAYENHEVGFYYNVAHGAALASFRDLSSYNGGLELPIITRVDLPCGIFNLVGSTEYKTAPHDGLGMASIADRPH